MAEPFPPWLEPIWQRLLLAKQRDRFGQALLLTGPPGIGKSMLLQRLTAVLLCSTPGPDGLACGCCQDCQLLGLGHHPDLVQLEPEAESASGEIRVEQVREICGREALTPTRGSAKAILVRPAEALNAYAANSLLKTLEEPVASTYWLLSTEQPQRLPQTIRSRCQRVDLPVPTESQALPWLSERLQAQMQTQAPADDARLYLRLAHGAPLRALDLAATDVLAVRGQSLDALTAVARGELDPVALAQDWQRVDGVEPVVLMIDWLSDLLRLAADPGSPRLVNLDRQACLKALVPRLAPAEGHRLLQRLLRARRLLDAPINKQLLFESVLVQWARMMQAQIDDEQLRRLG